VASSPNYISSSDVLKKHLPKLACIPHCLGAAAPVLVPQLAHWETRFGRNFFLFVGVLRYYKGLDYLLAAARLVKTPIVIVGEGPEGVRLRQVVAQEGLSHVHFLGALPDEDKNALLSLCRGVVFPSHLRSEAFGMTLLEGARAGKPLICCEIETGTTWINRHNETGLVVPPRDANALAQAMNQLTGDEALCARLGQGAFSRWQQFFTPQVAGADYLALYRSLLAATV
jgi:rhamnosyl/mannosyltransferase